MRYFSGIVALVLSACVNANADLAMIVNSNNSSSALSIQDIGQIFLKRNIAPKGVSYVPVDQDQDTKAYQDFYQSVLSWTPGQLSTYWSQKEFSGIANPPMQLDSNADVVNYVAHHVNAIGYVDSLKALSASVRVMYRFNSSKVKSTPVNSEQAQKRIAVAYKQWQLRRAGLLKRFKNARDFIPYVASVVHYHHLPNELALLPMLESGYSLKAQSGKNAMGLWQLMPETAQSFGVKVNWWFDGRLDVLASTKAAVHLLTRLHKAYHSWPLALAAYDAGVKTVNDAISTNEQQHKPTTYWDLHLPKETMNYVPALMALQQWVTANAALLPSFTTGPRFQIFHLHTQVPIAQLAKLTGQSVSSFKAMNAGLIRVVSPPDGCDVYVPVAHAASFSKAIVVVANSGKTWKRYYAHSQTFADLAGVTGDSVSQLRTLNPNRVNQDVLTGWILYQVNPGFDLAKKRAGEQNQHMLLQVETPNDNNSKINQHDSLARIMQKLYQPSS